MIIEQFGRKRESFVKLGRYCSLQKNIAHQKCIDNAPTNLFVQRFYDTYLDCDDKKKIVLDEICGHIQPLLNPKLNAGIVPNMDVSDIKIFVNTGY